MFSTKEYIGYVTSKGLARANRFAVVINLPSNLANAENTKVLSLMCNQTDLPSKTINTSETKYNGDIRKYASGKTYYQHQFVFNVSSDMVEKEIMDAWMDFIIPESHELVYLSEYATDIEVYQLNTKDEPVHGVKLKKCFPVVANPLTVTNADSNTVHHLMVQFSYQSWETILSTSNVSNVKNSSEGITGTLLNQRGTIKAESFFVDEIERNVGELIDENLDDIGKLSPEARTVVNKLNKVLGLTDKDNSDSIITDITSLKANDIIKNITDRRKVDGLIDSAVDKITQTGATKVKDLFSKLF